MSNQEKISVVLVDDSSVIRGVLARILESDPAIEIVGSVSNGSMGVSMASTKKPNVMILDVEMPVMDGISALPEILKNSPETKVIMCSSLTDKGADTTIKAMSLGALECIVKPSSSEATGPNSPFQKTLLDLVKTLGGQAVQSAAQKSSLKTTTTPTAETAHKKFTLHDDSTSYSGKPSILAIGSSTGGPQALFKAIKDIGSINIPIVITQHMPATFTKILAEHITQQTGITTYEGEHGMQVEAGKAYVAPGGKHMLFEKNGLNLTIKLDDGPQENFCKPAVDPMLRSLIDIYGSKVLCLILTGMGSDGLEGGKLLVQKGGRIAAQDEETSVVWGMPGAVATAGICSKVLPISEIGVWAKTQCAF